MKCEHGRAIAADDWVNVLDELALRGGHAELTRNHEQRGKRRGIVGAAKPQREAGRGRLHAVALARTRGIDEHGGEPAQIVAGERR